LLLIAYLFGETCAKQKYWVLIWFTKPFFLGRCHYAIDGFEILQPDWQLKT